MSQRWMKDHTRITQELAAVNLFPSSPYTQRRRSRSSVGIQRVTVSIVISSSVRSSFPSQNNGATSLHGSSSSLLQLKSNFFVSASTFPAQFCFSAPDSAIREPSSVAASTCLRSSAQPSTHLLCVSDECRFVDGLCVEDDANSVLKFQRERIFS
ncbi:unnamed protein product [Vicia faba]|uniref:Uncharacterized protein n=1 Tax=Vicia faba TaxID=3906 RepID=A0AAV0YLI9_VICFA|nr:unnamed protein product [Vicia faba]